MFVYIDDYNTPSACHPAEEPDPELKRLLAWW
jgi:hypothetical protein